MHRRGWETARRWLPLLALLLWTVPALGQAPPFFGGGDEDDPFDITADSVEFETDRDVYVARGNVIISQPEQTLEADWVVFSNTTRQGVASGNVVIDQDGDKLFADVLYFEIDELTGLVYKGELDGGQDEFRVRGDVIKRTGGDNYVFDDASFTTCRCPDDDDALPWTIEAETADVEFGGYATTRNTTVNVLGVPVLWTPIFRYPLKTDRESGFLMPTFNTQSREGFDFGLPFFWAISRNINLLLTPNYLTEHGFKINAEAEYVFGERSGGDLYGTFIDDDDVEDNDVSQPFDSQRWAVEWLHEQHLPYGWRWKVSGRFFSDNLYAFDYNDMREFRADRYLESWTFAENIFGPQRRYEFTGQIRYADDQQNPDDQDRDDFLLNRMPDLNMRGMPRPLPWFEDLGYYSFDARYTHFWAQEDVTDSYDIELEDNDIFADTGIDAIPDGYERNGQGAIVRTDGTVELSDGTTTSIELLEAAFNLNNLDPLLAFMPPLLDGSQDNAPSGFEGDGKFREGEPLGDRGHRFVLNPRIGFPFRIADTVEVLSEFGYYGTFYSTDAQSGVDRSLFTAQIDARTRLRRVIDLPFNMGRAVHLMEPRVAYTGIVAPGQDDNPLFIPRPKVLQRRLRQLDLWNVLRDPADRIDDVHAITLSVNNRMYVPNLNEPDEDSGLEQLPPRLFADFTFSFQNDFEDSDLRSFYVDGTMWPLENVRTRFNLGFDLDNPDIAEALVATAWSSEKGHDLAVAYRYVKDVPAFFENFRFDDDRFDEFAEGFVEVNQLTLFARYALTRNWGFTYRLRYSFEEEIFLSNQFGVEYLSKCECWAARVEIADDRAGGFELGFRYRVVGLGDDDPTRPFSGRKRGERSDDFDTP